MGIHEQFTRLFRTRGSRDREDRMRRQEENRARSPEDELSQREDRRLGGMSAEDRDWEQASLQRNRDREAATNA